MNGRVKDPWTAIAALVVVFLGPAGCGDGDGEALGPADPPLESAFGALRISTQTIREAPASVLDPDGYTVEAGGLTPVPIEVTGSVVLNEVPAGDVVVALEGLQVNCTTPANPVVVPVAANATTDVTFAVTCLAPTTWRIAFTAPRNSHPDPAHENIVWEIHAIDPDGRDLSRVTTVPGLGARLPVHLWPAWSPDGWKIAYTHNYNDKENEDIFVVNADGTGESQLTNATGRDNYPAWSPDGSRIAFSSDRDQLGILNIFVMNADGSEQARLTEDGHNERPAWSPDGSKILFSSIRDGDYEVYLMNADGTGETNLSRRPNSDEWISGAAWSPDGTRILFASDRDGNWDAFVMNADGTEQTRLTDWESHEEPHAWSPDGTKILFTSSKTSLVYIMNADGTGIRSVTHGVGGRTVWPDWSHGSGAIGGAP